MSFPVSGVLCAGNCVYDILVRSVERLPFGATEWIDQIGYSLGGNGANTSYALARLGVPVRMLSGVGRDDAALIARKRLDEAGVDTTYVQTLEEQTATSVVLVRSDGERAFLHRPGVSRLVFRDGLALTPEMTAGFSHFHLANVFALPGMRVHAVEILKSAKQAGLTVSLDTGWDSRGEWLAVFEGALSAVDLMFVNQREAQYLTGIEDPAGAGRALLRGGVRTVVVKVGAAGCLVLPADDGGEEGIHVPGFAVEAVDTTGAGDTFAAGFLAALHRGSSLAESARVANAVGALNVQKLGAVAGLRSWDETLAWMSEFPVAD